MRKLIFALYSAEGKCFEEKQIDVFAVASTACMVEKIDFSRHVKENPERFYVTYELYDEKGIIASGSEHFVPIKHFEFSNPEITAEISGMGKRFSVKLNSSCYAYAVKVDFEDENVNFSSNFINLYGKTPVVVSFETADVTTIEELKNKLKIFSPYSIGK